MNNPGKWVWGKQWGKRYDELVRKYRCRSYAEELVLAEMMTDQADLEIVNWLTYLQRAQLDREEAGAPEPEFGTGVVEAI